MREINKYFVSSYNHQDMLDICQSDERFQELKIEKYNGLSQASFMTYEKSQEDALEIIYMYKNFNMLDKPSGVESINETVFMKKETIDREKNTFYIVKAQKNISINQGYLFSETEENEIYFNFNQFSIKEQLKKVLLYYLPKFKNSFWLKDTLNVIQEKTNEFFKSTNKTKQLISNLYRYDNHIMEEHYKKIKNMTNRQAEKYIKIVKSIK